MSDFPPPPPQLPSLPLPNFNLPALQQTSRPARQAATLLFVLGGLALFVAIMAFLSSLVPMDKVPDDQKASLQRLGDNFGVSIKGFFLILGFSMLIPGLVLSFLGAFVRTGRRWAILAALGADTVMLLILALGVIEAVLTNQANDPEAVCTNLVAGALMIWLFTRLTAARREAKTAQSAAGQMQTRYWFGADSGYGK